MSDSATPAGKWLLGLTIYFILFFLVCFGVNQGMTSMHQTASITTTGDSIFNVNTLYDCDLPRCLSGTTCTYEESALEGAVDCSLISDKNGCDAMPSCSYIGAYNTTCFFYLFGTCTHDAVCEYNETKGTYNDTLNFLYLNDTPNTLRIDSPGTFLYNWIVNFTVPDGAFYEKISLSETPAVKHDETFCKQLGFTWYDTAVARKTSNPSLIEFMWGMYTFDANIGIPDGYELFFTLIFVWLPTLALLVCIWILKPF